MLRIHLTPADLRRVQVTGPDLMAELVSSAQMLALGRLAPRYADLARDVPRVARPLLQLVERPEGYPDFLIRRDGLGFGGALAAVLSTPAARVRDELRAYRDHPWTHDPDRVRRELAVAIDACYQRAFRPRWHPAAALASRDQALRAHILVRSGVDGLLASLRPTIRWRPPTLVFCEDDG